MKDLVKIFEETFEKKYKELALLAIKNKSKTFSLRIYFNEEDYNFILFDNSSGDMSVYDMKDLLEIRCNFMHFKDIIEQNIKVAYNYLNDKEKEQYVLVMNDFVDKDMFVHYNIKEYLEEYLRNNFKESYFSFIEEVVIKKAIEKVKSNKLYKQTLNEIICLDYRKVLSHDLSVECDYLNRCLEITENHLNRLSKTEDETSLSLLKSYMTSIKRSITELKKLFKSLNDGEDYHV